MSSKQICDFLAAALSTFTRDVSDLKWFLTIAAAVLTHLTFNSQTQRWFTLILAQTLNTARNSSFTSDAAFHGMCWMRPHLLCPVCHASVFAIGQCGFFRPLMMTHHTVCYTIATSVSDMTTHEWTLASELQTSRNNTHLSNYTPTIQNTLATRTP